jgi:tetratricopeptide (TPR) repeat protein
MTVLRVCGLVIALVASLPAYAQRPGQGDDESAGLVDEGRAALKTGALDDAAKALDQAIAVNPRRVDAYVLRSAVYAARKQYKQGIELMQRAQTLAPTDEEVLTALGSHFVLSGDTTSGVPLLLQVTGKNAARYDAQLLLGHHFHTTSKWPQAITAFEAYFTHRPKALAAEDARHRIELADAYLRFRKPKQALTLFQLALDQRGKNYLRARLGVAWATAAIDCRKARPLLEKLERVGEAHPEIWLVDGRCALALGDSSGALALGRKYLEKSPNSTAAGHALVGEAYAVRGKLDEARRELETARKLEPARRRWPVRLAVVLRRAGDHKGALEALDRIGAPDKPTTDPDWWTELGETLLAKGEAQTVVTRLTPVTVELPGDAAIRRVLGAALLATGQAPAAIKVLDEAEAITSTSRGKQLLVDALVTVAVAKLPAEPVVAEQLLVRADSIEGNALVWRNLGIARLALNKPADAVAVLDRAVKAEPSSITQMLAARARAQSGDVVGARPLYERSLATEKGKDHALEIAIDWAASELAGGDAAIAVTALEKTVAFAKAANEKLAQRHKLALARARHAAGVAALRAGNGGRAVELLRASVAVDPVLAARCDLALASVVAGDPSSALTALRAVSGQSCPFPPPADLQAAPILIAFTEGLSPRRAGKALERLTALAGKSSGPAAVLLGMSMRVVALEAAREAYGTGKLAQARKHLATARLANARVGNDEVAHNLAVLDLLEGRVEVAIAQLEKLASKLPDALVNLGIAYERKGEPQKALDAWRRARKAGARHAPLTEWIESKERVYGGGP